MSYLLVTVISLIYMICKNLPINPAPLIRSLRHSCIILLLFIPFFIVSGCSDTGGDSAVFENCNCPLATGEFVCGNDERIYLDSCFANCLKVPIRQNGNCPGAQSSGSDTLKWPIQFVCIPLAMPDDPQQISTLDDGSIIYQNSDGSIFRGTPNYCRCLAAETLIATPGGQVPVSDLKIGDFVFSLDYNAHRVTAPILEIRRLAIPPDYKMMYLRLDDERHLFISPQHPDADGNPLSSLQPGDCLDGGLIISRQIIVYSGSHTWDILPAGAQSVYFANDILIGSTINPTTIQL